MTAAPCLVVFDCDGTLTDGQHSIVAAMSEAFEACGLAVPERQRVLSIVGLSLEEAIGRLAGPVGKSDIPQLAACYRRAFQQLRQRPDYVESLYEGALDAVGQLAVRNDVVLGIATGKSRRGVARLLEANGLLDRFATIQTADDAPSKPHPAMLMQAMRDTGIDAARTAMVGDTSFDMEMAVNAGVHAIGVGWGYHPPRTLELAGARCVLNHFSELEPAIDALWSRVPEPVR